MSEITNASLARTINLTRKRSLHWLTFVSGTLHVVMMMMRCTDRLTLLSHWLITITSRHLVLLITGFYSAVVVTYWKLNAFNLLEYRCYFIEEYRQLLKPGLTLGAFRWLESARFLDNVVSELTFTQTKQNRWNYGNFGCSLNTTRYYCHTLFWNWK